MIKTERMKEKNKAIQVNENFARTCISLVPKKPKNSVHCFKGECSMTGRFSTLSNGSLATN